MSISRVGWPPVARRRSRTLIELSVTDALMQGYTELV